MIRDEFQLHRYALAKKRQAPPKPPAPEISTLTVNAGVMAAARREAAKIPGSRIVIHGVNSVSITVPEC